MSGVDQLRDRPRSVEEALAPLGSLDNRDDVEIHYRFRRPLPWERGRADNLFPWGLQALIVRYNALFGEKRLPVQDLPPQPGLTVYWTLRAGAEVDPERRGEAVRNLHAYLGPPVYRRRWHSDGVRDALKFQAKVHAQALPQEVQAHAEAALIEILSKIRFQLVLTASRATFVPNENEIRGRLNTRVTESALGAGWSRGRRAVERPRHVRRGPMRTERKLIHGQWVDVKVCPAADVAQTEEWGGLGKKGDPTLRASDTLTAEKYLLLAEREDSERQAELDREAMIVADADRAGLAHLEREVYLSVDVKGEKPSEVARRLGRAPGTIRSTLFRARRKVDSVL
jgi:hypothetical protein